MILYICECVGPGSRTVSANAAELLNTDGSALSFSLCSVMLSHSPPPLSLSLIFTIFTCLFICLLCLYWSCPLLEIALLDENV